MLKPYNRNSSATQLETSQKAQEQQNIVHTTSSEAAISSQNTQEIVQNVKTVFASKTFEASDKKTIDPTGTIPNGIMSVFRSRKKIKIFNICILGATLLTALILMLLFALRPDLFIAKESEVKKSPVGWYILLAIGMVFTLWRLILDAIDLNALNKAIRQWQESTKNNSSYTPAFVSILYRKLVLNQVTQNWITIAFVFYLGIFTLIFWALRDQQWGLLKGIEHTQTHQAVYALDFKLWYSRTFPNVMLWVWIFVAVIVSIVIIHIVFTILRKTQISKIESFMGENVIDFNLIAGQKQEKNRFYAKIFFISVLVILVIPIIVILILKRTIWRKK